ncbi:hypothetical protein SBADM41S_05831 [Streptomyces badius]
MLVASRGCRAGAPRPGFGVYVRWTGVRSPRSVTRNACFSTIRSEPNRSTGHVSHAPPAAGRGTTAVTPSGPTSSGRPGVSGASRSRVADASIQGASRNRAPSPVRLTTTAAPVVTSASSVRAKSSAALAGPGQRLRVPHHPDPAVVEQHHRRPVHLTREQQPGRLRGRHRDRPRRRGHPGRIRRPRPGPQRPAQQLAVVRALAPGRPGGEVDARGVRPPLRRRPHQLRRIEHRREHPRRSPVLAPAPRPLLDGRAARPPATTHSTAATAAARTRCRRRSRSLGRVWTVHGSNSPDLSNACAPARSGRPSRAARRTAPAGSAARPGQQLPDAGLVQTLQQVQRERRPDRPVHRRQRPVQGQFVDAARPGEEPQPPHHRQGRTQRGRRREPPGPPAGPPLVGQCRPQHPLPHPPVRRVRGVTVRRGALRALRSAGPAGLGRHTWARRLAPGRRQGPLDDGVGGQDRRCRPRAGGRTT